MQSIDLKPTGSFLATETRMTTRDLLVNLGFVPIVAEFTDQQPGYRYDFGNLVLRASQVTGRYFRPEIFFTGIFSTPRVLAMVDFSLLMDVESYEQGVALIAYGIGDDFTPLRPTPWLEQGREWKDHLPGRREAKLYAQRPQCHVEAEWFRVALKKLIEYGSQADDTQVLKVSFMSGVLKFELSSQNLVMPATGEDWPDEYICLSKGLVHLSKRTASEGIWLGVWKSQLAIGRLHLQIEKS